MVLCPLDLRLGPHLWAASRQDDPALMLFTLSEEKLCPSSELWSDILEAAAVHGSIKLAGLCLQEGAVVNDTALMQFWREPRSEHVYRFLVEMNAVDVNHYIDRTGNILGIAVYCGRHSLARFCLERGARPNERQAFEARETTLACAAIRSDVAMLALLLNGGAQLAGSGALMGAASRGKLDCVSYLIARGADVNERNIVKDHGRNTWRTGSVSPFSLPALRKAVEKGHLPVVQELLQAGADVLAIDETGKSVLDIVEVDSAMSKLLTSYLPIMEKEERQSDQVEIQVKTEKFEEEQNPKSRCIVL